MKELVRTLEFPTTLIFMTGRTARPGSTVVALFGVENLLSLWTLLDGR